MKDYFKNSKVLVKINQGDTDTFLEMYRFYAPKLFRHIYYRVNSKETAEDLAQQVFVKVWQHLLEGGEIDNLRAFLYKITNNSIIDYYRKAERKNVAIDEEIERKLPPDTSTVDGIEKNMDLNYVKGVLFQLNDEQRKLLIWRYFDDLSINQISKITKKSKNSIYVALHRALKELQNLIKKYENQ